ncbi:chromosomal replication initiator DnaA [Pseudooceanicola sediminis]|uniref:Chromosomal replication initiator DnaA n=1 Tax=Pseudooceanicola sediminis TaxID=2211117 RepID=A0A399IY39_9RHOB|nr:DnaA/Hda family protein [Pseudooceanicola sediminis]RII37941.1 chromosomal replication initiator DnaA [Pseudooceanicola sediminis]|tara:strand:- start:31486 stop:32184 length:699 start_codon:yes stop_codon:yes gene_type:complete
MKDRQKSLPLQPAEAAMGRDDFIVGPGNEVAFAMLESWPQGWSARKLALVGPGGAGKTHLTRIWAATSGASILSAVDLAHADIPALSHGPVAVEDVPAIAGDRAAEEALFHLHNLTLAEGNTLLVTARNAPSRWPLTIPDLASRMQACPTVMIDAPDDALLGGLLIKFFTDHQIMPNPDVIPFLLPRIERSFSAARRIAAALDAQSLAEKRPVTRSMAARVLEWLEQEASRR